MKAYLRPATFLFIALWLVMMVGGQSRFFQDPGTFWHTRVGDRILDVGFFDTDPYSFTFADQPWIPHQWLAEVAMSVVNRALGFDGMLVLAVTLMAVTFTGLGNRLFRCGLHPSLAVLILAAGLAASSGHFHVRPHLVTIMGMAAVFAFLNEYDAGRIGGMKLWWTVPLIWLWANCHGGALGGIATMGVCGAGWLVAWRIGRPSPFQSWRDAGRLVAIGVSCLAVCFINPYFERLPGSWLDIYQMKSLTTIVEEHRPIELSKFSSWPIVTFGVLYVLLLLTVPVREWRVTWLLPILWFVLTWSRVRHAPLFAVGGLVAIADFFPATRIAQSLMARGSDLFEPYSSTTRTMGGLLKAAAIPALLVIGSIVTQSLGVVVPVFGRGWAQHSPAKWPVDLLPELREHQFERPGGTRIFNENLYGGFLIYHVPGYKVFVDDRCELYGDAFLVRFVDAEGGLILSLFQSPQEPFDAWEKDYGRFDFALVETGAAFDLALREQPASWRVIRETPTATFYRRLGQ